jgi:molybdate transport system permease protein
MMPLAWLDPDAAEALALSLKVAGLCVACISVPGILAGLLLARARFPGKVVLDALLHLPLVLPPVVTGFFLLEAFGRKAPLGRFLESVFGLRLAFTTAGAALAASVVAFPLMVRSVRLAMELVDRRLEQAAATLGASAPRRFLTVTLPLASGGVLAGMILAFARSLGEFGATITFAGNIEGTTRTLPLSIYTHLQSPTGQDQARHLVLISACLSVGALVASEILARRLRKKLEAVG